MKRIFWLMLMLVFVGCGGASNQSTDNGDVTTANTSAEEGESAEENQVLSIAVVGFTANTGISQSDIDGISAIFTTYFMPQGYTLVERMRIDKIIEEQNMQRGSLTNSDMVRLGELLNVQKIVVGDIAVVEGQYNIDVRVVDVERGTIAATDGAAWVQGSSYRAMMQSLATRLSQAVSIKTEGEEPIAPPVENEIGIVFDYLKVFPYTIGTFEDVPNNVIEQLNKQEKFGYNTWRIPTQEELSLLAANGYAIDDNYMCSEHPRGVVLLVTDDADASAVNDRREQEAAAAAAAAEKARIEKSIADDGLGRDGVYEVGYYYNRDGKQGVVFEVTNGGRNGKIISLEEVEKTYDGAQSWCRIRGAGWYLPSKDELLVVYSNKSLVNKMMSNKGKGLIDKSYWTCSLAGADDDYWVIVMSNGDIYSAHAKAIEIFIGIGNRSAKTFNSNYVRAVSAF